VKSGETIKILLNNFQGLSRVHSFNSPIKYFCSQGIKFWVNCSINIEALSSSEECERDVDKVFRTKKIYENKTKDNQSYYYHKNLDKFKERKKDYYKNSMDKTKESKKEYYKENLNKIKESKREYYKDNLNKIKETQKEYRMKNREIRIQKNPNFFPNYSWKSREQSRMNMESIATKFQITDLSDWYRISVDQMKQFGGVTEYY
jgi:hypothetical protein